MIAHGAILQALAAEDRETLAAMRRGFALLSQAAESAELATDPANAKTRDVLRASAAADARNGWQHLILALFPD